MKIQVGDIYSTILDFKDNLDTVAIVRTVCRAHPNGYKFMRAYKTKHWDGYICLMKGMSKFPTGLLDDVLFVLKEKHIHGELVGNFVDLHHAELTADMLTGIELRDYQLEAAKTLLDAKRGVAKMATNSGKTEVMAAILKALNVKSVVLVRRKELMYQTAERFKQRGLSNIGMIGDGIWDPNIITVAMIQTLGQDIKRCKIFKDNQVLIIDECHNISSKQSLEVFYAIPGMYRFGVSGTPLKHDVLPDLQLVAATGPIAYELTNEYLIEEGYSAVPEVLMIAIENSDEDGWELNYQDAYDKYIVNNETRNKAIAYFAYKAEGTVLIMVNMIRHGELLAKMTGGTFVSGKDTTEYRKMILKSMDEKGIFIASPIFDEGIDVPGVNAIVLAGGGKSQVKQLQRIGRGLRKKFGINTLKILDFIDDTNKHLLKHSENRVDTYTQENFDVEVA